MSQVIVTSPEELERIVQRAVSLALALSPARPGRTAAGPDVCKGWAGSRKYAAFLNVNH